MMITKLEDLIGKNVELLVSGHFFTGQIVDVDPATDTITFIEDAETSVKNTIDATAIALVKVN